MSSHIIAVGERESTCVPSIFGVAIVSLDGAIASTRQHIPRSDRSSGSFMVTAHGSLSLFAAAQRHR